MNDDLLKNIASINEKLHEIKRKSRSEPESADFLISNAKTFKKLSRISHIIVNAIDGLRKRKYYDQDKNYTNTKSELKLKKLEEKRLVENQLTIDTSLTQIEEEVKSNNNDEVSKSSTILPQIRQRSEISINCYICKKNFHDVHFFYDKLCDKCARYNYNKRTQNCDFAGRVAVVTGCRIKIGYEICLYLLRHNCYVIGTTRFAKECFIRYSKEPDFDSFKSRFQIYSLDLRDLSGLYEFIAYLYKTCTRLDILINNAAQTLRRNVKFYDNILATESKPLEFKSADAESVIISSTNKAIKFDNNQQELSLSAYQSQIRILPSDFSPNLDDFPKNTIDKDGQQVDLTYKSSWNLEVDEINVFEFAETQIINTWSPFILCSKLKDLFLRGRAESSSSPTYAKYIINVSSMEGKFMRSYKSSKHVHTNMSKAGLNMLSRCSSYYANLGIYMNSVDTGWVTEMHPGHIYSENRTVPLDEIDGAMRVLDPIIKGINKNIYLSSIFFKNYCKSEW